MSNASAACASDSDRVRRLSRYFPDQARAPLGLLKRLVATRSPEAYFAMAAAIVGVAATPIDRVLARLERRLHTDGATPGRPILLVCGAPRSGTSLATQILINHLPVHFFNNLTSVLPRSPLIAHRLTNWLGDPRPFPYRSFYGKTYGLRAPNDALYLWDRWLGLDRKRIPDSVAPRAGAAMRSFFAAVERATGRPVIGKNNNLNVVAHVIAEALPTARFICMRREPAYLAQALWVARLDMYGATDRAYGVHDPEAPAEASDVEDVCRQVLFHEAAIAEQARILGTDRFHIVDYEALCRHPAPLVEHAAHQLGASPPPALSSLQPFRPSRRIKVTPALFAEFQETLERLGSEAAHDVTL